MLTGKFDAKIRTVTPKVRTEDEALEHSVVLGLSYEFTSAMANGIGGEAVAVQKALCDGGLSSATIPVDADLVVLTIEQAGGGEVHEIKGAKPLKVAAKKPNAEDSNPTATVTLSLELIDEDLCYLAQHQGEVVTVEMSKQQLELGLE